jgi:hypothetical protein
MYYSTHCSSIAAPDLLSIYVSIILIGTKYPYSPSDNSIDVFKEAVYGNFTYQLVLQDLTKENASLTYSFLDNPNFAVFMGQLYGCNAAVMKGSSPLVYDPVPLYFSSGYSSFAAAVRVALTYSLTVAGFVWLSYW